MLKSTHQPAPRITEAPLPPGWTEHKAPSGHPYYYNVETKQSTYTRPQVFIPTPQQIPAILHTFAPAYQAHVPAQFSPFASHFSTGANRAPVADFRNHRQSRPQPQDRPKTKHPIPGCTPWLLIKTRLGRRFVHNPETKESFWKYPKEVVAGVVEFDIQERKRKELEERGEAEEESTAPKEVILGETPALATSEEVSGGTPHVVHVVAVSKQHDYDSDEYEEVEVTDEEDVEEGDDASGIPKRRRTTYEEPDSDAEAAAAAALEFTEEDMAAQLAAMGASYDLAPDEFGADDQEWEGEGYNDEEAGLELTADEATASFTDMLTEHGVDPYKPWDAIIESTDASILSDARYTLLPTMKARRQVFSEWSASRIAAVRLAREKATRANPRVAYIALLAQYASPKLYWPEFKRKFKKEAAMKDIKLVDREREKLYREHVARITKLSDRELERDLEALLRSVPASKTWNRSTGVEDLPEAITIDVRYISLKPGMRDALIRKHIKQLPRPDDIDEDNGFGSDAAKAAEHKKRRALHERQLAVEESKRRQQKELQYGRSRLQEEEQALNRALNVGKTGLRGALVENTATFNGLEQTGDE